MDLIEQYNLIIWVGAPIGGLLVALLAWRVMRNTQPARAGLIPESPDPELTDEFGGEDEEDSGDAYGGPSPAVHDLEPPPPPAVGLAALRVRDPAFSEPVLVAELAQLFAAAWTARGSGELGSLSERFSDGGREAMLAGRHGAVREVLVAAPTLLDVAVGDVWANVEARFEALVTEVRDGAATTSVVTERWALARQLEARGPWIMRQLESRELAPLARPPLERGSEVEPGTSLATLMAPDLEVQREALLASHPDLDLDALSAWLLDFHGRVLSALDAADPAALGDLITADLRGTLELETARLARTGLRARHEDAAASAAELCRVQRDPRFELLTLRVHASCRTWLEDEAGQPVSGSTEHPRIYSEYWTLLRPVVGEAAFARGRQGFVLWRIQDDEAYNGG